MSSENSYSDCPKCGDQCFERLETYGFCFQCNYSSEDRLKPSPGLPRWVTQCLREAQ